MNKPGIKLLQGIQHCRLEENKTLALFTSYGTGGVTHIWAEPYTIEAVGQILVRVHEENVPLFVLGFGSNVLVADQGWPGVTLTIRENLESVSFDEEYCRAGAGTALQSLIHNSISLGFGGMELLSGIPGSVGGALRMNAGAFGQEISETVKKVYGFRLDGTEVELKKEDIDFSYRSSPQLNEVVITEADFQFIPSDADVLKTRSKDILDIRSKKQPLEYPSCGSVFKRPPGYYAGVLIEEAGLKGKRVGNAVVSTKHAGFIVNQGNASSEDIYHLIQEVQEQVYRKFGVRLEREVKLIGWKTEHGWIS